MKAFRITSTEYHMNQPSVFLFVDGKYYGDLGYPRLRNYPSDVDYWRNATCADSDRHFYVEEVILTVDKEMKLKKLHACVDVLKSHIMQYSHDDLSFNREADNFNRPYETALSLAYEKIDDIISSLALG